MQRPWEATKGKGGLQMALRKGDCKVLGGRGITKGVGSKRRRERRELQRRCKRGRERDN